MGWEKLRTYIGTDELWELESKKNKQPTILHNIRSPEIGWEKL